MKLMLWTAVSFVVTGTCFAAGGGAEHEPSIKDLMWPAFNFIVLFGFMGWKLKKPISKSFTERSVDIAELYEDAGKRIKEAEAIYDASATRLESLEGNVRELKEKSEVEVNLFEERQRVNTETTIAKMKSDCASRIEHEKKQMAKEANAALIDEVVKITKDNIASNDKTKSSVTEKLLAGLQ